MSTCSHKDMGWGGLTKGTQPERTTARPPTACRLQVSASVHLSICLSVPCAQKPTPEPLPAPQERGEGWGRALSGEAQCHQALLLLQLPLSHGDTGQQATPVLSTRSPGTGSAFPHDHTLCRKVLSTPPCMWESGPRDPGWAECTPPPRPHPRPLTDPALRDTCCHTEALQAELGPQPAPPECPTSPPSAEPLPGAHRPLKLYLGPAPGSGLGILAPGHTLTLQACLPEGHTAYLGQTASSSQNPPR